MTGRGVAHRAVPDYSSLSGLVRQLWPTMSIVWRSVGAHRAALVRLPEPLSLLVASVALMRRRTIICNIVADPATISATGPKLARQALAAWTRAVARRSDGVIYVTREYLQRLILLRLGPSTVPE